MAKSIQNITVDGKSIFLLKYVYHADEHSSTNVSAVVQTILRSKKPFMMCDEQHERLYYIRNSYKDVQASLKNCDQIGFNEDIYRLAKESKQSIVYLKKRLKRITSWNERSFGRSLNIFGQSTKYVVATTLFVMCTLLSMQLFSIRSDTSSFQNITRTGGRFPYTVQRVVYFTFDNSLRNQTYKPASGSVLEALEHIINTTQSVIAPSIRTSLALVLLFPVVLLFALVTFVIKIYNQQNVFIEKRIKRALDASKKVSECIKYFDKIEAKPLNIANEKWYVYDTAQLQQTFEQLYGSNRFLSTSADSSTTDPKECPMQRSPGSSDEEDDLINTDDATDSATTMPAVATSKEQKPSEKVYRVFLTTRKKEKKLSVELEENIPNRSDTTITAKTIPGTAEEMAKSKDSEQKSQGKAYRVFLTARKKDPSTVELEDPLDKSEAKTTTKTTK